ncbi:MAG: Ig-like domain-containing protein [Tannerella sp.]|jgi:hypothetical protein|nr:Ig-like domain-containing protein [Tannerella sp.]
MMKQVFVLCAIAAGILLQSCSKDKVALTGLSVTNTSNAACSGCSDVVLPAGERIRVTVKLTPSDADDVTLVWTSSNESVASVSDGILSVSGVGTAVITLSSGTVSTTFNVEGTIRGLTVAAPAGVENRLGAQYQLTATPDPADAQISPVWTSDNEAVATVSATGEVTVTGEGTANIRATVGAFSPVYTVVCEDMLASAVGYWEFDDRSDIGKALKGNPLVPQGAGITWVEGPSAENLAIEVPMHEYFIATLTDARPTGGTEVSMPSRVHQWTMMIDFRLPTVRNYYYSHCLGINTGDGDFFIRYRDDQVQAGRGNYFPLVEVTPGQDYSPWIRAVFTCEFGNVKMYCNGVEMVQNALYSSESDYALPVSEPMYLFADPKGTTPNGAPDFSNSDDDNPFPCAAVAFWDKVLNDGQVQALGGIAH